MQGDDTPVELGGLEIYLGLQVLEHLLFALRSEDPGNTRNAPLCSKAHGQEACACAEL
eukprot:CAMPEP_0180512480 /NCGR_PEP_ID=MMETSP1036_2-20121128/51617_1 /TAXON_ID=632150 /ORGANISM="Azadinium spinosum, Strain 3D9" /LENGTH=57 /DNA_ID=CAMNT_0022523635 /DNA_START=165 /DNA_END=335 /DNA_ORIENTATION=-